MCRIAAELGDGTTAPQERCDIAIGFGFRHGAIDIGFHAFKPRKIGVDVSLGLLIGDSQLGGESEGTDPIDNPEVDGLCHPAHIFGDLVGRQTEDLHRRGRMDVVTSPVRADQDRIPGEMRQDPRLNLVIISREQDPAGIGCKSRAYAAAPFTFNGDVLQIGV